MPKPKMLLVRPVGTALVTDYAKMERNIRAFIGRKWDPTVGDAGGFVPTDEDVEVPEIAEYIHALRDGDLEPRNAQAAKHAGVIWQEPKAAKAPPPPVDVAPSK